MKIVIFVSICFCIIFLASFIGGFIKTNKKVVEERLKISENPKTFELFNASFSCGTPNYITAYIGDGNEAITLGSEGSILFSITFKKD